MTLDTSLAHAHDTDLQTMAHAIRVLSMDAVEQAKSGHPGMPMGMADAATVLFTQFLSYDPTKPDWANRDRFVLSAGHGSMLLYSLLHLTGHQDMPLSELKRFRQLGAKTCGHPEYGEAAGIETTTGPLGQGLANAVGMALAERLLQSRYTTSIVDHYTYVIAGDGCLMEGISQEAISFAGHLGLGRLIVLFDDNDITIDGGTDLSTSEDQQARFAASGWHVQSVDGHNMEAVAKAIAAAKAHTGQPSMIACKTTIGFGAPTKAGTAACHGAPLGAEEIAGARARLGWEHGPFEIPESIKQAWEAYGARGQEERKRWEQQLADILANRCTDTECPDPFDNQAKLAESFLQAQAGTLPASLGQTIVALKEEFAQAKPMASRKSSGLTLEKLTELIPTMIGGSADLTGSNNTKVAATQAVTRKDFSGRYIYYGIREHAMAAMMNGMALHGGILPYSGTFFVFSDYCRPAIRLSALMEQQVIYVMTHDSIGLGEDGPTHQPVEHLASLRAMPGLRVLRPADAVEVAECWQLALEHQNSPSMLVLSRQNLPTVRLEAGNQNLAARGGYILREANQNSPKVVLIATGSEVQIACEAQQTLEAQGIATRVVSLPCTELFESQEPAYREEVLGGEGMLRVGIEAGVAFGWERYLGRNGIFIGMEGFGASAPASDLYQHFGITAEHIVARVKEKLA